MKILTTLFTVGTLAATMNVASANTTIVNGETNQPLPTVNDFSGEGLLFDEQLLRFRETHDALLKLIIEKGDAEELYNELLDPESDLNIIKNGIRAWEEFKYQGTISISDKDVSRLREAVDSAEERIERKKTEPSNKPLLDGLRMASLPWA